MKAYWVARSKIINKVNYKKFTDLVPDIIEKYNDKILACGGNFKVLEGTDKFHRFVIIEFPSLEEEKNVGHQKNIKKLHHLEKMDLD